MEPHVPYRFGILQAKRDSVLSLTRTIGMLMVYRFGSFVVSDIGSFGLNTGMTALMPAAKIPCVIVLGKMEEKPVVRNGEVVIRTVLPLTGTFDHRIVDGMQIGKLARGIKRNFRKPEWLDEVPEKELAECLFEVR